MDGCPTRSVRGPGGRPMAVEKPYCEYCQEQDLKHYIINLLGDVFCSDKCHELYKQFYVGEYEIIERKEDAS